MDEESGAVVGVMVGTRMDSTIDGVRGWGRPAESIFEACYSHHMFIDKDAHERGRCSVFRVSISEGSELLSRFVLLEFGMASMYLWNPSM